MEEILEFTYKWTFDLTKPVKETVILQISTKARESVSKEHGKMIITQAFLKLRNGDYLLLNMLMTPISMNSSMTIQYAQHLSHSLLNRINEQNTVDELLNLYFTPKKAFEDAGYMMDYYTEKEYRDNK